MQVISDKLFEWNKRDSVVAPLSDKQKDTVHELAIKSNARPFPTILRSFNTKSYVTIGKSAPGQRPTGAEKADRLVTVRELFEAKLDADDASGVDTVNSVKRTVSYLESCRSTCDDLVRELDGVQDTVGELRTQYEKIATKSRSLHSACEQLISEQAKLTSTAESLTHVLSYFDELDRIQTRLSLPSSAAFQATDKFIATLNKIDECLLFFSKHPNYKDVQVYQNRAKQCLSKCLSLVRDRIERLLEVATSSATNVRERDASPPRLPSESDAGSTEVVPSSSDDSYIQLYGKFRVSAPRVKVLASTLEQRIGTESNQHMFSDMYVQTMNECYQFYLSKREQLLLPCIRVALSELSAKHNRDQCAFVRSSCTFLINICEDEAQLFTLFFTRKTPLLNETLSRLCTALYDVLRPMVIHVNHLETLSELCCILKQELLENALKSGSTGGLEGVDDNSSATISALTNDDDQFELDENAFATTCRQILQDVQERLTYRTHIYIKDEIAKYKPSPGDLAYPEKLEMMMAIAQQQLAASNATQYSASAFGPVVVNSNMPLSPADLYGMWYPTVRRTLSCLSKLARSVDKKSFEGLAQEALLMCVESLFLASRQILVVNAKSANRSDAQLFLIKHLLILREQIAPFHTDFAIKETELDFSSFRKAAYDLLQRKSQILELTRTNALLQFLLEGTPDVKEHIRNTKHDLDLNLKVVCEDFIRHATRELTEKVVAIVEKVRLFDHNYNQWKIEQARKAEERRLQNAQGDDSPVEKRSMAEEIASSPVLTHLYVKPLDLKSLIETSCVNMEHGWIALDHKMSLYLANRDTEVILQTPIRRAALNLFEELALLVEKVYSPEDVVRIAVPSKQMVLNMLNASRETMPPQSVPHSPGAVMTI